nr:MAG TPA: hypothetical protein [Caudoviricetes sp.]
MACTSQSFCLTGAKIRQILITSKKISVSKQILVFLTL